MTHEANLVAFFITICKNYRCISIMLTFTGGKRGRCEKLFVLSPTCLLRSTAITSFLPEVWVISDEISDSSTSPVSTSKSESLHNQRGNYFKHTDAHA